MDKKPLIILTGPTAVGKTALSIALAKKITGEMISADSMQVYRGMDVGTAKIMPDEMEGIPHHLIDVLDPKDSFDVVTFQTMAKKALDEIYAKGKIPIVVGGTGFYIQALLYDIDFSENDGDDAYRKELTELLEKNGADYLYEMLRKVDPASCEIIHKNNHKRVIRALEFYHQTGQPISEHNEEQSQRNSPYNFLYFVLNDDRQKLYDRIELRIDKMVDDGLLDEVKQLKENGCKRGMVSMEGLGYKEILDYLDGKCTLEDALYILKRDTRHFAKRQITWFKREKEVIWLNRPEFQSEEDILNTMIDKMKERDILV